MSFIKEMIKEILRIAGLGMIKIIALSMIGTGAIHIHLKESILFGIGLIFTGYIIIEYTPNYVKLLLGDLKKGMKEKKA